MKNIVFKLKNGNKTTGFEKYTNELVELTVKSILDGQDLQYLYEDGTEIIIKADDIASFEVIL